MKRTKVEILKPKRGKKLYVMRWVDPRTGRERQQTTGTANIKKARDTAAEKELEIFTAPEQDDRMTWPEFRKRYETEVLSDKADGTVSTWNASTVALERKCKPKLLVDVTASMLSAFAAARRKDEIAKATVAKDIRTIRVALSWAVRIGLLDKVPQYHPPKNSKRTLMRSRPINDAEFKRMLEACKAVRPDDTKDWEDYLHGLYLSGIRSEESTILDWDGFSGFSIDLSAKRPRFKIFSEHQKGDRDEYTPITPDFSAFLLKTPEADRKGKVFAVARAYQLSWIKRVVGEIGQRAGIVVDQKREQFAGSQTLRRSFGTRWAKRVRPPVLQRLMRHKHISTTMEFYVELETDDIAEEIWANTK